MSAGQGSSTDPLNNNEEEEKEEEKEVNNLAEQLSKMTIEELTKMTVGLPKELQRLIYTYRFKNESVEDRKNLQQSLNVTIQQNQDLLNTKQSLINRYNELEYNYMHDVVFDMTDVDTTEMANIQRSINQIGQVNDVVLAMYEQQLERYNKYIMLYNHRYR